MAEVLVVRCDRCGLDGATLFCTFIPDPAATGRVPPWLQTVFDERKSFDALQDGRKLWRINFCEECARATGVPDRSALS